MIYINIFIINSTFEITAEWLPPEVGTWIDEDGNVHTVDQEPATEVTVNYELFTALIDDTFADDNERPIGPEFTLEGLEIRHQPYGEDEMESVVLHSERWLDRYENGVVSDVQSITADGELNGAFFARLSIRVNGEPCFVEGFTELLFEDEPLPEPGPPPAPEPEPEPEPGPEPAPPAGE